MRRSTVIVSTVIILVLSAGIAALSLWPEPEQEPEPTPAPSNPTVALIDEQPEDVSGVFLTPQGGNPYTLRPDGVDGSIELYAEDAIFSGVPHMLNAVFNTAISLTNLTVVTSSADEGQLSMLGFDEPVMTLRIERTDGTYVELMVGAMQSAGQGRYVRKNDSHEVLLLNQRQALQLTYALEDLYDLSFLPATITADDLATLFTIEHILLETQEDVIELRRVPDEELEAAGAGASIYRMLQPVEGECNDYMVQSVILEKAAGIMPESIEDLHPADLSAYGLDVPARLSMITAEWSGTLLIGNHNGQRNGRYVMLEGYDAVLFDPNGDYSFLDIPPAQLRARLVWLHHIADVSSLSFELDGISRELRFEHNADENSLRAWLDDKEISDTNARRLYVAVLNITQSGGTEAAIPNAPPVYSITVHFLDGGSDKLDLYRLSDSQFLIVHGGVSTGFFITRLTLQQNFLSRFDILDRGEDIPS